MKKLKRKTFSLKHQKLISLLAKGFFVGKQKNVVGNQKDQKGKYFICSKSLLTCFSCREKSRFSTE
jgi:hypothetical protein